MAFQTKSEHGAMSEINVTPLVDVMLVLLVVFLVTAPLLVQSIPVELPKTAPAAPIPDIHHIDITVNAEGKIFLDSRPVEIAALETELKSIAQLPHQPQVLIQEMNREANTIGSKSSASEIAHLVVSVKEEIERIREQLQNIE